VTTANDSASGDLYPCSECSDVFVVAPAACPNCGTWIEADVEGGRPRSTVRSYRLNRLGRAGGVMAGGIVTALAGIAFGRPFLALSLLLLALVLAGLILLLR